jgi:hypothetical protein
MKGTLSLTSLNLKFKSANKDQLYYGQFKYVISFELQEVSCLRTLDHEYIDAQLDRRKEWAVIRTRNPYRPTRREITADLELALHNLADHLLTTPYEFKLVVSMNQGYVYTNFKELIYQLDNMPSLQCKSYGKAVIVRPKNTIQLKNPKHKFRSYFKFGKITEKEKENLINFLINQHTHMRISPALWDWVNAPKFNSLQDYYFIDYDSETWLTMLSLIRPGAVRKTMQIIPAK